MIMALHGVEVKKIKRRVFCFFFLFFFLQWGKSALRNHPQHVQRAVLPVQWADWDHGAAGPVHQRCFERFCSGQSLHPFLVFPRNAFRTFPFPFVLVQSQHFNQCVVVDFKPLLREYSHQKGFFCFVKSPSACLGFLLWSLHLDRLISGILFLSSQISILVSYYSVFFCLYALHWSQWMCKTLSKQSEKVWSIFCE